MMLDNSYLEKRSIRIAGHRTSIALEPEFWTTIQKIANLRQQSIPVLFAAIDSKRARENPLASLASAIRVFALTNKPNGGHHCG